MYRAAPGETLRYGEDVCIRGSGCIIRVGPSWTRGLLQPPRILPESSKWAHLADRPYFFFVGGDRTIPTLRQGRRYKRHLSASAFDHAGC